MSTTPTYVTPRELADEFGISVQTVRALIKKGTIPAVTLGPRLRRINRHEAEQILRGGADD